MGGGQTSHDIPLPDVFQSMADGVITTDLAGTVRFLNPAAERLTGWNATDACGLPVATVFDSNRALTTSPADADQPTPAARTPTLIRKRSGETVPVDESASALLDQNGSLTGLVLVFRRAPHMPLSSETAGELWIHLAQIAESLVDPLFTTGGDWEITFANRGAEELLASAGEEAPVGQNLWVLLGEPVDRKLRASLQQALLTGTRQWADFWHASTETWYEIQAHRFGDGLMLLFQDTTRHHTASHDATQAEKITSLGLLARGFGHQFNNLLTAVLGNLSLAATRATRDPSLAAPIDDAKHATLRAQNYVQQLLTFTKGGTPLKRPTDIGRLIGETLADHSRKRYEVALASGSPEADIDPGQIKNLLVNLIKNAEEACSPGDTVTVHCNLQDSTKTVSITVEDTGCGIPQVLLNHVFEPYYTTRHEANASGIGLTVCESITRAHSGDITIRSEENTGTTVTVELPLSGVVTPPPIAGAGTPEPPPGQRVLILEDEPLVSKLAAANLHAHGHYTDITTDGADTVDRYREALSAGTPYDVLILDLTIPDGMGGAEAISQIREFDPGAVAIVSSGYSDDPAMAHPEKFGFNAILPKPYKPQELADLVATLGSG